MQLDSAPPVPSTERSATGGSNHVSRTGKRFRVLERIAEGATSDVYRAIDERTGRAIALKRLKAEQRKNGRALLQFEREFRTLLELHHPCIIEVYEFGWDDAQPYYTMELLEGRDVRKAAPMPYAQACRYLRDLASSLALLHSRRLIHRDVSPANARLSEAGRCKLIDFGSLSPFGVAGERVGTVPYMAPEQLWEGSIDHRADLFSLGATAYFMLTGRSAFVARRVKDLQLGWQNSPRSLREYDADIPEELAELVLSLMRIDPSQRPSSAAEVIAGLNAIGNLEPAEEHATAAQSYWLRTPSVGYYGSRQRVRAAIVATARGNGAAFLVEGRTGSGKTRFIEDVAIDAQLAGALVLHVNAGLHQGPQSVVRALAKQLEDIHHDVAERTVEPFAPALGALGIFGHASQSGVVDDPDERTLEIQDALVGWIAAASERVPLVVLIDEAQAAFPNATGLLAALAARAHAHRICLVTAMDTDSVPTRLGVALVREQFDCVRLDGFDATETRDLVRAVFGETPYVQRVTEWLHRLSRGNPAQSMELIRHLIDRGFVRYVEGSWVLPHLLPESDLPHTVEDALQARLQALPVPVYRFLQGLSISAGGLTLEHCVIVAECEGLPDALVELDALVRDGLIVRRGDRYCFYRDDARTRLSQSLDRARRSRLHRRLGHAMLGATTDPFVSAEAGFHLLEAGEEPWRVLAKAGVELAKSAGGLEAAVPALEAAVVVLRRQGHTVGLIPLLTPLVAAGYHLDRRLADRYGDETLRLLAEVTGLSLLLSKPLLRQSRAGVLFALACGKARYYAAPPDERLPSFDTYVELLLLTVSVLSGIAAITLDAKRMERMYRLIEPLRLLGDDTPAAGFVDLCRSVYHLCTGQLVQAHEGCRALEGRFDRVFGSLDPIAKVRARSGLLYCLGTIESFTDGSGPLEHAAALERLGRSLDVMLASQLRFVYHSFRGEIELAEPQRRAIEARAVQRGTTWQVEISIPMSLVHAATLVGDSETLKQTAEQLEQLSASIPSLRRYALLARGSYRLVRGDAKGALTFCERATSGLGPRDLLGWFAVQGVKAAALSDLEEYEKAIAICDAAFSELKAGERQYVVFTLPLEIQKALAIAYLGDTGDAALRLEKLIEEHANGGPITLGSLHRARALVALVDDDAVVYHRHRLQMERLLRKTKHPALLAECGRMAERGPKGPFRPASIVPHPFSIARRSGHHTFDEVGRILQRCRSNEERADCALQLVLGHLGSPAGYLFAVRSGQAQLISPRDVVVSSRVLAEVHALVRDYVDSDQRTLVSSDEPANDDDMEREALHDCQVIPLIVSTHSRDRLVGVVAVHGSRAKPVNMAFCDKIAQELGKS